jgi:hypothetical protein
LGLGWMGRRHRRGDAGGQVMNEKPVKRYHMTHDRDFQRILAEVSGQEFLKFAQYVRSEDYDALKAENERLREALALAERLASGRLAMVEQLTGEVEALRRDAAIDASMEDKT